VDYDLLHGEARYLADLLGCSVRSIKRYKANPASMREPERRLLRLRRRGDLSALLGSAWEGFSFSADGLLFVPGWSNGMRPEQVRAMFFTIQEAAALRSDVRALRLELWALRKTSGLLLHRLHVNI
jgi:hypothetical protein